MTYTTAPRHKCPSCRNEFLQPFVCTTCGAQKLYDATVTSLQESNDALAARLADAAQTEARLRRGLQFYADGCHCELGDPTDWDSVSGEPSNFLCDEHGSMIEDGTVAQRILEGYDIGPDDNGEFVFIDAARAADSAGEKP